MRQLTSLILGLLLLTVLQGCCMRVQVCCRTPRCPPARGPEAPAAPKVTEPVETPAPAKPQTEALYDGATGNPESLMVAAEAWKNADLVAFGELHGDRVGAKHQLALLQAMHEQERPVALAMEFFERDTQPVIDAYLAGEIDEATMRKKARQGRAYPHTHGPLIEFCKENGLKVIAANAPRRLVTAYRKQSEDYDTWRASLTEADQGWLPEETSIIEDEYHAKFMGLMGGERGARIFKSQSLWDDAMAEAIVDHRSEAPACRVLLIVGGFHVTKGLGTITKYRMRRGKDEVRILTMTTSKDPQLAFTNADLGAGDLVLKVRPPKARRLPKARPAPKP